MGDLSNFKRGQIVAARLAGAFVTKAVSAYMNCGKTTSVKRNSERKSTDRTKSWYIGDCFEKSHTSVKRNSERKSTDKTKSWYIGDCFEKSHNYWSTGGSKTKYILKTLFPQKLTGD
jgi:hypothetical protein